MTTYTTNDFQAILKGRRSIRQFDESVKISKEEMTNILQDTITAPSSVNMQPWRFVVAESSTAKEKLTPLVRFNQNQNNTSSAMILIFGDLKNFDYSEQIYGTAVEQGLMPAEVKEQQLSVLTPLYKQIPADKMKETVLIDGSLAAMQLMLIARTYGYETSPIGGFERDQLAAAFDLDPQRYVPVMIVAIGKGLDAGYPSYRLPVADITTWV
ncbi:nitroreductase family protein [Vagococcus salmoninarum]|uniref:nitroreductase family protein n=1 Tax=Vagococcus salmoninarum TaxID=2739 RepID=UPI00187FCAEE|nr:nitroreductase family protein [Vagococcus salmoninarum]MBE9388955.1 nitroreductase family protein [Vagococcus salmoninarum]